MGGGGYDSEGGATPARNGSADSASRTEELLADLLGELLGVDRVPGDANFFDDLGADSMVMARFCARLRKRSDLPSISMKDVYAHPTVRSLAATFGEEAPSPDEAASGVEMPEPVGTAQYALCGAFQLLVFVGFSCVVGVILVSGYEWISAGSGLLEVYLRSVGFGSAAFLGAAALPVIAKWLLIGRWTRREIRVWSPAYLRFWLVKTLIRANPMVLFAGSPLYVLYLRALGAKIGPGVVILSRIVPVCTDLLTIGAGTVIRKDSLFTCYRAEAGVIRTGPVTVGKDAIVGEVTVLDIDTAMGDWAQIGHASALYSGQTVPAGERWHGSPAQRTGVDYRAVPRLAGGRLRRFAYGTAQLLNATVLWAPLAFGFVVMLLVEVPQIARIIESTHLSLTSWAAYVEVVVLSLLLFFGPLLLGLVLLGTVPRVLNRAIRPGRVYPLYGIHFGIHRAIGLTNARFYRTLLGDSSWIVGYLRYLGYRLRPVQQTGSNFGIELKHENPHLSSIGTGTMVADGLSMMNGEYSSTSFRVSPVAIGAHNFVGNHVPYPPGGRTGDNCLLATKVMIPIDGPVREGVGLLGSPAFEIPRTVERDAEVDRLASRVALPRRLAAKNRHNAVTIVLYLLARWVHVLGVTVLAAIAADHYHQLGALAPAAATIVSLLFTFGWFALVERAFGGFRQLRPLHCSIYSRDFWRHERFWKGATMTTHVRLLDGTPFKAVYWRAVGVRVGRRLFDDGCGMPEKTLVTIGDDVTLNFRSIIQCHSQEDGAFKSDQITIGSGCTVGVGAWVHYGVRMGDGATLEADSFLMKGEEVPRLTRWGGNPARELRGAPAPPAVAPATAAAPSRKWAPGLLAAALVVLVGAAGLVLVRSREPQPAVPAVRGEQLPAQPVPGAGGPSGAAPPAQGAPEPASPAPVAVPARTAADLGPVATPFRLRDLPLLDGGLRAGSEGAAVATLQHQLRALGYDPGAVQGRFGEVTTAAVRAFQAEAGVTRDPPGTVGRATAVALAAAGARPELAYGATGEDVHRLQHALVVALARPLAASGDFRSATRQAVSDYQSTCGLPADGVVDEATWAALQRGR